jgi:hypothetical protein
VNSFAKIAPNITERSTGAHFLALAKENSYFYLSSNNNSVEKLIKKF